MRYEDSDKPSPQSNPPTPGQSAARQRASAVPDSSAQTNPSAHAHSSARPTTGARIWRHIICNTHCTWLPGDPRGFRNREHRIHSSGDYKNPPPTGEHAGLYTHNLNHSGKRILIPDTLRQRIAEAFANHLRSQGCPVSIASASETHVHALTLLPLDRRQTKRIIGDAKRVASRSVKAEMPGRIWSEGGTYKPVRNAGHYQAAYEYIRTRQEEGAYVLVLQGPDTY
jgi:REP element-mobilizing transposase RayT